MCTYWQLGNFQFPTHKPSREAGWASWEMTWLLCLPGCGLSFCNVRHYRPLRLEKTPDCSIFCVLLLQILLSIGDQLSDAWFMMSLYLMALSIYVWFYGLLYPFMLLISRLGCIAASLSGYVPNGPKGCDEVATPPSSLFNFGKSCANPALGVEIVGFHSFG